ncbi:MAG: hypothetical protein N2318_01360, partial [Meiothermus sp.]|nr:hypothetical protein [Meiothermus sp.]
MLEMWALEQADPGVALGQVGLEVRWAGLAQVVEAVLAQVGAAVLAQIAEAALGWAVRVRGRGGFR